MPKPDQYLAQALGNLGNSLQGLGMSIYDADAQRQTNTGLLGINDSLNQFNQERRLDPDYGRPAEAITVTNPGSFEDYQRSTFGDGWAALSMEERTEAARKWESAESAYKQSLDRFGAAPPEGFMARWEERDKQIRDQIGEITNPTARKKVMAQYELMATAQKDRVHAMQVQRWSESSMAEISSNVDRIASNGDSPLVVANLVKQQQAPALAMGWLTPKQADDMLESAVQYSIGQAMKAAATDAYNARGLEAAQLAISGAPSVYPGTGIAVSKAARDMASDYITQYDATVQDREYGALAQLDMRGTITSAHILASKANAKTQMYFMDRLRARLGESASSSALSVKEQKEFNKKQGGAIVEAYMRGDGGMLGPQAIASLGELRNITDGTGLDELAYSSFVADITKHTFPVTRPYLDGARDFAMKTLFPGKAEKAIDSEGLARVTALETSVVMFISDRMFERGGDVQGAEMDTIVKTARAVATGKAFDQVRVGGNLFASLDSRNEKAIAKHLGAFDSEAGRMAVFTDPSGNTQYLTDDPSGMKRGLDTVEQYGRERLAARGIEVAGPAIAEKEGLYDITAMRIYNGTDGLQYRIRANGDEVELYSRGSPSAEWKKLPDAPARAKEPTPEGTAVAEYPMPSEYLSKNPGKTTSDAIAAWNRLSLTQKQIFYIENRLKKVVPKLSAQERNMMMGDTYIPPND